MPRPRSNRSAAGKSPGKSIEAQRHEQDTRINIPTARRGRSRLFRQRTMPPPTSGVWEQSRKRCPPGSGAHPAASMMKRSMPSASRETPVCSAPPAGVSFVLRGVRMKRDIVENEAQVRRAGTVVQSPPEPEVARH